jgi:hypothetical protein
MELLTFFYILNATLLLLHEIESAFEKEWELLKLPGNITAFIIMHIPIIMIFFYGLLEIDRQTRFGLVLGILTGVGGLIPLLIHKFLVRRKGHFNRAISNFIIFSNAATGIVTIVLSARFMA